MTCCWCGRANQGRAYWTNANHALVVRLALSHCSEDPLSPAEDVRAPCCQSCRRQLDQAANEDVAKADAIDCGQGGAPLLLAAVPTDTRPKNMAYAPTRNLKALVQRFITHLNSSRRAGEGLGMAALPALRAVKQDLGILTAPEGA